MSKRPLVKALSIASVVLTVVLVLLLGFGGYLWMLSQRLPDLRADPDALTMAETSVVYASDGTVLAEWFDEQDRTVIANDAIPQQLKDATVAI